jgi:hypothetical protein
LRSSFIGPFRPSEQETISIWKSAAFAFDANVLLNLYRYSDETRNDFLKLLKFIDGRAWLPEQAALEFLSNRASVINAQFKAYEAALREIEKLKKSFSVSRGHPFLTEETKRKFEDATNAVEVELTESKHKQDTLISSDDIKADVAEIFKNSVGEPFTSEELEEICIEGAKRYANKVPPGFKDGGKIIEPKTENDYRSNYGDLIIWKQIINFSKQSQKDIIFITDDRKDDWWEEAFGKTLGPRPELIKEFYELTGNKVLFYTPEVFLQRAHQYLNTEVKEESIQEVKSEQVTREERLRDFSRHHSFIEQMKADDKGEHMSTLNESNLETLKAYLYEIKKSGEIRRGASLENILFKNEKIIDNHRIELDALKKHQADLYKDLSINQELIEQYDDSTQNGLYLEKLRHAQSSLIAEIKVVQEKMEKLISEMEYLKHV